MAVTPGTAVVVDAIVDPAVREAACADPAELKGCDFVANWLIRCVGLGGTFSVADLRAARDDAQIDRRMRDLRPMGWSIPSSKDVQDLGVGLYRFEKIGTLSRPQSVSGRLRREVFERDHHRCLICGVSAGETYPDAPDVTARLQIGHITPKGQGGLLTDRSNLRTECERCNAAVGDNQLEQVTVAAVQIQVQNLQKRQKAELLAWMRTGRRQLRPDEHAYYRWLRLSPDGRTEVQRYLTKFVGED